MPNRSAKDQAETLLTTIHMVIPYKVESFYLPDPGSSMASAKQYRHIQPWQADHEPLFTTNGVEVLMFQALVWDMPFNHTTLSLYLTNSPEYAVRIVRRKGKRSNRRMVGHPDELPNWQWSYNGGLGLADTHIIFENALKIGGKDAQAEPTQ